MKEADFLALLALDRRGVFPREGESAADFLARTNAETPTPVAEIPDAVAIPQDVIAEGGDLTEKLYAFRRTEVQGFFLSRGVGLFWGGCAISDPETDTGYFLLRAAFARRKKWFCYRRDELLAHELCHVARGALQDPDLEEYFAYRTSYSGLRRAIGDLFSSSWDALLFLVPTLLLPLASFAKLAWFPGLPLAWFYALLGVVLGYFAIRSISRRHLVAKAKRNLEKFGIRRPFAVLFRSTAMEIAEIARLDDLAAWKNWIAGKCGNSLRWEIIAKRFCV